MMTQENNNDRLGFLKFEGKQVQRGLLDARKASEVLLAFDESMRFFLSQTSPSFQEFEFELPVGIRKGSWETFIPEIVDNSVIIQGGVIYLFGKYFGPALEEMAKNDFEKVGFKSIFKKAFISFQNVLKLTKHLKSNKVKDFGDVKFDSKNELIGIENDKGELIWIPKETLEHYASFPKSSFEKIASLIEEERELVIGVLEDGKEKEERVSKEQKKFFLANEEDSEILFPELEHGSYVSLEGHLTRGNENSNTVGFMFKNHVLTCYPQKGNITLFKNDLFTNCTMNGYVDRLDKFGNYIEKRPKIRFIEIISQENNSPQDLFSPNS